MRFLIEPGTLLPLGSREFDDKIGSYKLDCHGGLYNVRRRRLEYIVVLLARIGPGLTARGDPENVQLALCRCILRDISISPSARDRARIILYM